MCGLNVNKTVFKLLHFANFFILDKIYLLDPPGVGAKNLQECLLIQLKRKKYTKQISNAIKITDEFWKILSSEVALSCLVNCLFGKNDLFVCWDLISKPFWPGQYQREILTQSTDKEVLIKLKQIEQDKMNDLNTDNIESAKKIVAGTARSMGIKVEKW